MKNEHPDIADALDPARFARQYPKLDQALRSQLAPLKTRDTFRAEVWQRIATQRAAMTQATPRAGATLRTRLLLQCANIAATGIAAALVCWAAWPSLRLPVIPESMAVSAVLAVSGSILLVGAQRLGLFRGLREFGT